MAKKPTEEEFDDIFDVDEDEDSDEFEIEDDDEDEDDWDDDEDEVEDDDEDDWDSDEEEEDLSDEVLETAVAAGKAENNSGISSEVLEEQLRQLEGSLTTTVNNIVVGQFKLLSEEIKKLQTFIQGHFNALKNATQTPHPQFDPKDVKTEEKPAKKASNPKSKSKPDKGSSKTSSKEASPKSLSEKAQAAVLSAYGSKKNRKGTDAMKFAQKLSERKFKGKIAPEQILSFLESEKLIYTRGKNSGTFKK